MKFYSDVSPKSLRFSIVNVFYAQFYFLSHWLQMFVKEFGGFLYYSLKSLDRQEQN